MDSGLYAAYAGLLARTQALDVAANNLANAGTNGFRAGTESFRGVMAERFGVPPSQVGSAVNHAGILAGSHVSRAQGLIAVTGNPMDLAIEGQAYFSVKTASGTRYTRDGAFRVSDAGTLTDAAGNAVLGESGETLTIPTGALKVGADGTISVATVEGSAVVGKLGLVDFGEAGVERAEGASLYRGVDGAIAQPASATVRQGSLEGSNEDAVHGTMQLMLMQRQAEMMQRALTVFHNDFDKVAAEELPRV